MHHAHLDVDDVKRAKAEHPDAVLVVHPECPPEVQDMADQITSTSGMLRFCKESNHKEFIIGTEEGILHRLRKESPDKQFYVLNKEMVCPNMKRTKLRKRAHGHGKDAVRDQSAGRYPHPGEAGAGQDAGNNVKQFTSTGDKVQSEKDRNMNAPLSSDSAL